MKTLVTTVAVVVGLAAGCAVEEDSENTFPTEVRGKKHKKKNCTYTQGYWRNHLDAWPGDTANIVGCGQTWPETLETPPAGDAFYILAHQWIAATLNRIQGADTEGAIDDALQDGGAILWDCQVTDEEREEAIAISELLDAFNNGLVGPVHCDELEDEEEEEEED